MPNLGVYGLSYWASARASSPLSRAIHSRQMESVGGLFCTSKSPSHGITSNAPTTRAGQAPGRDYTSNAHTWGYFCCSAYDSYYSTNHAYYIRAFHHHIGFGVSRLCAYLSNTHHHTCYSLPADGWDVCPSGPADCYALPNSTAPRTSASASAWCSRIIRAFSSSWGYYSTWGHYHSIGPDSATSGCHHSYTRECIISTWGSHYFIIEHLFILLYLHIILLEICPCFDTLYSRIGCITWSYLILYFLILIYRHYFLYLILLAIFLFPLLIALLFLLAHVVSPILLRLHFIQDVPLPPFIFNCSWHIEDNVDFG